MYVFHGQLSGAFTFGRVTSKLGKVVAAISVASLRHMVRRVHQTGLAEMGDLTWGKERTIVNWRGGVGRRGRGGSCKTGDLRVREEKAPSRGWVRIEENSPFTTNFDSKLYSRPTVSMSTSERVLGLSKRLRKCKHFSKILARDL